jgi:hypothetical protein
MSTKTKNTSAFYALAWIAFVISVAGTLLGLYIFDADIQTKGFFIMSYLFSLTACFTVAKVIRDRDEDDDKFLK